MKKISLWTIGLLMITACSGTVNHQGKIPLVEVDDAFLYKEDVDAAMPIGIHGEDSVRFAEYSELGGGCVALWKSGRQHTG